MDKLKLRLIKEDDNFRLAEIIRGVFIEFNAQKVGTVYSDPTTDNLYDLFKTGHSVLWVAEVNGQIEGCCGIYPTEGLGHDCTELVKFYLHANAREKGVGRALIEKCMESARQLAYSKIYIESLPEFDKAVSMYHKAGFVSLDKPLTKFGHPGCNLWFLKDLEA
jgi:putative acetyltransferase